MNRNPIGAASSPDLTKLEDEQPTCRSKHCLGCGHMLDSRKPDWIGLPAGVKFDPTDQELIEHLEAKVNSEHLRSHPLIDEFIRTIKGEDGICYTHPEKLPGVTRNGLSKHFFHRPSKAYTTGTRKRRKIQTECDLQGGETRWHKTGKTRPVMVNGNQKGCKKILVLYTNFGKHRKPEKTNWVMHQYHLGDHEEEKDGELVVSKIFYQTQPRQCNWSDKATSSDAAAVAAAAANVVATTTTVSVEQQCCFDHRRPESTGSGSCSSSKDVVGNNSNSNSNNMRDDLSSVAAGISAFAATSTTPSMEHMHHHQQHIKAADNFSFSPFRKTFDEVGLGEKTSEQELDQEEHDHRRAMVQQQQQQQQQQRQVSATSAFHVSRPSNPIAAILAPAAALHHSSIILDDPYQRFLHLQNDRLQITQAMIPSELLVYFCQEQQQQEQVHQHHKLMGRPTSGLEELIMGCAPSGLRGEPQIEDSHGTEWLKYSYWPDPDNQDDHHHG